MVVHQGAGEGRERETGWNLKEEKSPLSSNHPALSPVGVCVGLRDVGVCAGRRWTSSCVFIFFSREVGAEERGLSGFLTERGVGVEDFYKLCQRKVARYCHRPPEQQAYASHA